MEELNLGDLDFDTSGIQLFDDATGAQDPKEAGATPPATGDTPPASTEDKKGDETNTGSDGTKEEDNSSGRSRERS